jgi:pilus assembly protein TadC
VSAAAVGLLVAAATWWALPRGRPGRPGRFVRAVPSRPWSRPRRAGRHHEDDVAEAMDLLALVLEAGSPVEVALRDVAEVLGDPLGQELRAVAAAVAWGLDDEAAWRAAPPRWGPAAEALSLARRVGAPPAGLLSKAADDARSHRARRAEQAASALTVRLVIPLAVLFLPAFVLTTVLPVVLALATELLTGP